MTLHDVISALLILTGCFFFLAGTAGLIRFPDVYTRLHALTKADNIGLGFITVGLMAQAASLLAAVKLLVVWLFVLYTGSLASYLVANAACRSARDRKGGRDA